MSNNHKRNILIFDDDQQLAEMMASFLSLASNCHVKLAHDENIFWNTLEENHLDIIFLDYRLPGITGLDILEKLSAKKNQVPVVMMTGEGNEQVAAKAIQSGAFDYLVKGEYGIASLPTLVEKAVRLKEMQQEVERSLSKIQFQATLLDNMRDAVVVWDTEGKIIYWNYIAEKLFGFNQFECLGTPVKETYLDIFSPPIDFNAEVVHDRMEKERQITSANEKTIWVSSQITPLYDSDGDHELLGYMDVVRDITTRKYEQEKHNATSYFLERVISSSPDLVFIYNLRTGRMRFANPVFERILGYSPQDIYAMDDHVFENLLHPEDIDSLQEHLINLQTCEDQKVEAVDFRIRDRQGKYYWFSGHESVFSRDENGMPLEIIGIAQNISEKKQTEYQLQRQIVVEKLLSSISNFFINLNPEQTDLGVEKSLELIGNYILPDYGVIYLIEKETEDLKYFCSYEKIIGENGNLVEKDYLSSAAIPWLISQLKNQESLQISQLGELPEEAEKDKRFFRDQGIEAFIAVPMIYNNELIGVLSMFMKEQAHHWSENHTHTLQTFAEMVVNALVQKRSQEALLASENRYRAIVDEHQTESICRINRDLTLSFVNETFCKYFSRSRDSLLGVSISQFILPEDVEEVKSAFDSCSFDHPTCRFQFRVVQNTQIRWLEWVVRAIYSEQKELIEYQSVGHDITENKIIEQQLQTAQSHLTQNVRMAAVGELAASVAHQISNPLTTIIAEAQLLTYELNKQHSGYESAQAIIQAGWRAQHVIQELLKFSEPPKNTRDYLDINETIQKAIFLTGAHIQANGTTLLSVNLAEDLPKIRGNLQQMEDLWVNLLLLAHDALDDNQQHTIGVVTKVDPLSEEICVEIIDDGKPLSNEDLDSIFEPKLIPTGLGRGTGIELSLCREIVRQHQGKISAKIVQKKTVFEIRFPGE